MRLVVLAAFIHGPPPPAATPPDDVVMVDVQHALALPASGVAHTIYLNRCATGCTVRPGDNDAVANTSSIISQTVSLSPFAYSDATWNDVVACVRQTYAPYDVQIVETEPDPSSDYIEAMVAGDAAEIGQPSTTLGFSPMASDCSPQMRWISFVLANQHADNAQAICATVAHETGHVYGLDHTYECKDPMTYLTGCGQKFFLNLNMQCGEFSGPRACHCDRTTENTHVLLTQEIGAGTLPPPPMVTITYPTATTMPPPNFPIYAQVDENRVVNRVEFWINGTPWSRMAGNETTNVYRFETPGNLPDGVENIEVRAYDDLLQEGKADVTVTKGAPCTSAATCADGQTCDSGACTYPPPTLELGDACTKDADCKSFECTSDGDHSVCTEPCSVGLDGVCSDGFTCIPDGDYGACWPNDLLPSTGCCDTEGSPGGTIVLAGFLGLVLLRRRRDAAA